MAEKVLEKAYVYYLRHRRGLFLLDFENAIYSITLGKVQGMDKARQMAARMTDVWGRLGGAINVVASSFGQVLLPPLEVLDGHIVEVLGTLNRWIGIAPNLFRWIGYLAVASVTFAGVMGLVAAVTGIGKLALVGMAGPLKLVAVAFGLLTKVTGLQTAAQWLLNSAILPTPSRGSCLACCRSSPCLATASAGGTR